jgi:hypothetical protein
MTWKNKGEYKPYPAWALKYPWIKKVCAVCGIELGGAVPQPFYEESLCFGCPDDSVSHPQCNIPEEES